MKILSIFTLDYKQLLTSINANLQGYERMNLCDALESKRFLNGQMIIVQGDQANGMYFIESGVSSKSIRFIS